MLFESSQEACCKVNEYVLSFCSLQLLSIAPYSFFRAVKPRTKDSKLQAPSPNVKLYL